MTIDAIIAQCEAYPSCDLVEVTGGEPLLQAKVHELMTRLCDLGKTVLIETSGSKDVSMIDPRVIKIMDLKPPGSGEVDANLWSNIDHLGERDEVKFVIASREDYEWSKEVVERLELTAKCSEVLFSPVFSEIEPVKIVQWILADGLDVRFQLQMHKFIWSPDTVGV